MKHEHVNNIRVSFSLSGPDVVNPLSPLRHLPPTIHIELELEGYTTLHYTPYPAGSSFPC